MNIDRLEYLDNFDYTIFDDIINNINFGIIGINQSNSGLLISTFIKLFNSINVDTLSKLKKYNDCSILKYKVELDVEKTEILWDNCIELSFNNYFSYLFYKQYMDYSIDDNHEDIEIYRLYSLLYRYRLMDLNNVNRRGVLNAFYSFLMRHDYLNVDLFTKYENNYINNIIDLIGRENIIYIDVDIIFIKYLNIKIVENILKKFDSNLIFKTIKIQYLYMYDKKKYIGFKNNEIFTKGLRKKDYYKIETIIKSKVRKNKIEKILNDV